MKHLSILFLIFLVITISGCIGQDVIVVSTKDGVIITDFSFEHSPVYAEDNVGLGLEVQNVGDNIARLQKYNFMGWILLVVVLLLKESGEYLERGVKKLILMIYHPKENCINLILT